MYEYGFLLYSHICIGIETIGTIMSTAHINTIEPKWLLVDANNQTLGRMAARIARILQGKHKAHYSPHIDHGDFVVVVNSKNMHFSGNKLNDKKYYRHSRRPGGLKTETLGNLFERQPEQVLHLAVKRMLPKGPRGYAMLKKLRVFADNEHNHQAQQPQPINLEEI